MSHSTAGRKRLIASTLAAAIALSLGAAPTASAGQTWGGNGYVDYYGFCYYNHKKPATHGTVYAGARRDGKPGRGVTCKAWTWEIGGEFAYPAMWERSYSWKTICKTSGWRSVKSVSKNGTLICKN